MKGEPGMGESAPLAAMLSTATVVEPTMAFPAKRLLLLQLQSIPSAKLPGGPPAGNGDPGTGISLPVAEMPNMDTVLVVGPATARNLPSGVTLIPSGKPPGPPGNGDPGTGVRTPFAAML